MRFFATVFFGLASLLNAAPAEYFQAIMASEQISSLTTTGQDIIKIEQTGRLRCPGGYEFLVTLGDFPDVERTVAVYTEDGLDGNIEVHMAE